MISKHHTGLEAKWKTSTLDLVRLLLACGDDGFLPEDTTGRTALSYFRGPKEAFELLCRHSLASEWTSSEARMKIAKDLIMKEIQHTPSRDLIIWETPHTPSLVSLVVGLDDASLGNWQLIAADSMADLFIDTVRAYTRYVDRYYEFGKLVLPDDDEFESDGDLPVATLQRGRIVLMRKMIMAGIDLHHVNTEGNTPFLAILKYSPRLGCDPLGSIDTALHIWLKILSDTGVDLLTYGEKEHRLLAEARVVPKFPPTRTLPAGTTLLDFSYGSAIESWSLAWLLPNDPYGWLTIARARKTEEENNRLRKLYSVPGQWIDD